LCSRHKMIWRSIFSLMLMTFNIWIKSQLVHDFYLKSMEGHLLMIINEISSYNLFSFCINRLPQVVVLIKAMDYLPL
jgi:hypothetical protein